jgi:hypothetical protein
MADTTVAGDAVPPGSAVIEVRIAELRRLFNAIDPSPFRERDLDPRAEEFIVEWGREAAVEAPLALLVHLERPPGPADEAALLADAVHRFFADRREASRRQLRQLFRTGRIYLLIGLTILGASITLGQLLLSWTGEGGVGEVVRESLLIGGWVAMWRPLEVFLYDWWPIRADIRLLGRLAAMPVRIRYLAGPGAASDPEGWRRDWPARGAADLARHPERSEGSAGS